MEGEYYNDLNRMEGSSCSRKDPVECSCGHDNEFSQPIKVEIS